MPTGWELFTSDGKLQANSSLINWHLRKTGTLNTVAKQGGNTIASSLLVPKFGSYSSICAVQNSNGLAASLMGQSSGNWNFATDGAIGSAFNYFVFDRATEIPNSNFGIDVWDEAGNKTFSAQHRPMSVVSILGTPPGYQTWGGEYGGYYDEPAVYSVGGKSFAYFNAAWAGHRFAEGVTCYDQSGQAYINETGEPCLYHGYLNNGKMYGGRSGDGTQTVYSASVSFDDVPITMDPNPPPPDYIKPLKLFVVDVTNYPIGQTFF